MKKIHLHIGTFKTGTSSIQDFLLNNKKMLGDAGYFVPSSQLTGHHEYPLSLIKTLTRFRAPWPEFSGGLELWDKLKSEINSSNKDNVIISSEIFCDLYNENCRGEEREIKSFIRQWFSCYDVYVYCYLRPLHSYSKSMYGENIKNSPLTIPISERIYKNIIDKSIHLYPSTYLEFFSSTFGRDKIRLRKYDRNSLYGGDAVFDFLQWIGCDLAPEAIDVGSKETNPSIPEEYWSIKRAFNEFMDSGFSENVNASNSLIGLIDYLKRTTEFDYEHAISEISCEHSFLKSHYDLDLGDVPEDAFKFDAGNISVSDMFIISQISRVFAQNKLINNKLDAIFELLRNR